MLRQVVWTACSLTCSASERDIKYGANPPVCKTWSSPRVYFRLPQIMRRGMSRTPPIVRARRSATPQRRNSMHFSAVSADGVTPPANNSMSQITVPGTLAPTILDEENLCGMSPDPSSPRRSVARPTRRSLASPDAWASPMTDLARAPATIVEGPSQPDSCHDACAFCQQPIVEDRSSRSPSSIWRFPCRCRMRMHLACTVQMRVRNHAPACMHCRDPWPGESADATLVSACQQANVSLEDSWENLPEQPEHDILEGMPPRPDHVLVLCCASVSRWGGAMHAREMEWSPNRMFQINEQGIRVQIGWQGESGCNTCGRTILHEDPEINGAVVAADSANFCPADGQRTLIVDLAHGSRNWVCLPGCTLPTCMERVCPDENIPDQRHDQALLVPAHGSALPNFFSALPPRQNHESTNSFVYCPILLHSAGLLEQGAYVEWCGAARWFEKFCRRISLEVHDAGHLAQAYAELLQISDAQACASEHTAVTQLRELCSRYPPGTRLGLRCVIPAVVDRCGHIPNMLQDLLLQVYAGLPFASDLDRAVSSFRVEGQWPNALPSLLQPTSHISPDVPDACNANMSGPSDANAGNVPVAVPSSQRFPTHLHQHACVQRRSAQCGTRRRCRVCNNQIPHQSLYFHCSQNCRFTVCMDCFRSNNAITEPVSDAVARGRCASEPPRTRGTALDAPPISGSAYGQLRFTRHVHMSREGFIGRINALVAEGRFAHIGVPQIRIEGTTGWGV